MKTSIYRAALAVFCMLQVGACTMLDSGSGLSPGRGTFYQGDGRKTVGGTLPVGSVLVSAVSFPEEYDWKRDSACGTVRGVNLLLLQGRDTVLCIPAGVGTGVGVDPDMIHYLGGQLFTEYSDALSTLFCRDGEALLTVEGRCLLRGLLLSGGDLYTITQSRSGAGGFCFRRGGETLCQRDDCTVLGSIGEAGYGSGGALYETGGDIVFAFCREGVMSGREWYLWRKGRAERLQVPTGVSEVFDVRLMGDDIYLAAALETGERPVIVCNSDIIDLSDTVSEEHIYSMRLCPEAEGMGLVACYKQLYTGHARGKYFDLTCTGIWSGASLSRCFYGEGYVCSEGSRTVFVRLKNGRLFDISEQNTDHQEPPSGYTLYGMDCARLYQSRLYMAMSSVSGEDPPALWIDGKVTTFAINGYLTGVYIVE